MPKSHFKTALSPVSLHPVKQQLTMEAPKPESGLSIGRNINMTKVKRTLQSISSNHQVEVSGTLLWGKNQKLNRVLQFDPTINPKYTKVISRTENRLSFVPLQHCF